MPTSAVDRSQVFLLKTLGTGLRDLEVRFAGECREWHLCPTAPTFDYLEEAPLVRVIPYSVATTLSCWPLFGSGCPPISVVYELIKIS
jgi:hypothetical protein